MACPLLDRNPPEPGGVIEAGGEVVENCGNEEEDGGAGRSVEWRELVTAGVEVMMSTRCVVLTSRSAGGCEEPRVWVGATSGLVEGLGLGGNGVIDCLCMAAVAAAASAACCAELGGRELRRRIAEAGGNVSSVDSDMRCSERSRDEAVEGVCKKMSSKSIDRSCAFLSFCDQKQNHQPDTVSR